MSTRPEHLAPVPPMERYRDALRIFAYSMPHKHRQLLLQHYRADDHTATATELSQAVGYPDWRTVNLQYGTFSRNLAERMKWVLPATVQASYAVAWFESPGEDEAHWQWHMHPELAHALEELGWVKP